MGIKLLLSYINGHCSPNSKKQVSLSELSGKSIVIDTSIYLFKFKQNNLLITNMETLVLLLRKHNITAYFVFDPPPANLKIDAVKKRSLEKKADTAIYTKLQTTLVAIEAKNMPEHDETAVNIRTKLAALKPRIARVSKEDRENVRNMFDDMDVEYITPPEEADMFCAHLVAEKRVWGVASNDTDMFVYGCEHVIMDIDLETESAVVYHTPAMLSDIGMTFEEFKDAAIISTTEYALSNNVQTWPETALLLDKYRSAVSIGSAQLSFVEWLIANNKTRVKHISEFTSARNKYDIQNSPHIAKFKYLAKAFGDIECEIVNAIQHTLM